MTKCDYCDRYGKFSMSEILGIPFPNILKIYNQSLEIAFGTHNRLAAKTEQERMVELCYAAYTFGKQYADFPMMEHIRIENRESIFASWGVKFNEPENCVNKQLD